MATRTIANAGGNWNTAATWVEAAVPTAADEVVATATSGNLTVDTAAVCRSINLTNYVGTLTINNTNSLAIGDATLPTGNIALLFPTGMTVACNTPQIISTFVVCCGNISFVSTAVGVQTIDFNSDNVGQVGNVIFDGVGGSWQFVSNLNTSWWGTVTITRGTVNFNGLTYDLGRISSSNSNTRTITMGASQIHLHTIHPSSLRTWEFDTVTNLTFTANTAHVRITQEATSGNNLIGTATFNYNGLSMTMDGIGALHTTTTGTMTLANFTVEDTAVPEDGRTWCTMTRYQVNTPVTVTNSLTFLGADSGRRIRIQTNSGTSLRTFGVTGATVTADFVDFFAISFNVAQNFSANTVGNEAANTNITFPTGATQYFYAPGTGNKRWSYPGYWFLGSGGTGGAGRCPLPQDTVRFDSASFDSPGVTVVSDTPRIGGGTVAGGVGIDWTGVTNNPNWHFNRAMVCYGDMKLGAGMTTSATRAASLSLSVPQGTHAFTWTSAGVTWALPITFSLSGTSTVQLQDDLTIDAESGYLNNNRGGLTSSSGGLDCNNHDVTCNTFNNASGLLTMGSGTFTLTGRGTVWSSGGTVTAGTSLIRILNNTRYAATFAGNGRTYNNLEFAGTGSGTYTISGSNTFNTVSSTKAVPFEIAFTSATNNTVTSFTIVGTAGNYVRLRSTSQAANFTLTKAGGGTITSDYLIVSRSTAAPAATWSATNSVDGGNNTAWGGLGDGPKTWTGAIDNNFSLAGNWNGGVPGAGDIAFFIGTYNVACTVDAAANVKGWYMGNTYTATITQAATVTVGEDHYQQLAGTFTGATQALAFNGDFIQLAGTFTPSSGGTTFGGVIDTFFSATAAYNVGNLVVNNSGGVRLFLLVTLTASGVGQNLTINAGSALDTNGSSIVVNAALTVNGHLRSTGADLTVGSRSISSATSTIELAGGGTIVLDTAFATDLFNLTLVANKTVTVTAGATLTINGTISPGTADAFNSQATPNRGQCQVYSTIDNIFFRLNLQGTSTVGPALDLKDCDARYGKWFECKGSQYILSHACKHQGNYRCIEKPLRAGRIFRSHKNGHLA